MQELAVHSLPQLGLSQPEQLQELELELQLQQLGPSQQQLQELELELQQPQRALGQAEHQQQALGQAMTLLERSGNSPAAFMTMVKLWAVEKELSAVDIITFADEFMMNKLFMEVSECAARLPISAMWWRRRVHDALSPGHRGSAHGPTCTPS